MIECGGDDCRILAQGRTYEEGLMVPAFAIEGKSGRAKLPSILSHSARSHKPNVKKKRRLREDARFP